MILRVPAEISDILKRGTFPEDTANPLVCFEFTDGTESLFDTRKGLFLNPPAGISLPPRESLKAFGRMILDFRSLTAAGSGAFLHRERIGRFEVCC